MIEIKGRTPSKKNSFIITVKNGRILKFPGKLYQEWHKDASNQLKLQGTSLFNDEQEKLGDALHLKISYPDSRASDLTNKAESVMDLLVDNGLLKDDNWFEVNLILLQFTGVDRENAKATVTNLKKECPQCGHELYK